jgi:peroxiredoxin
MALPDLELEYAEDASLSIAALAARSDLVIFFYRGLASLSNEVQLQEESRVLEWVDNEFALEQLGYEIVGVSVQTVVSQARLAGGEPISYCLLSDPELRLAAILELPTSELQGKRAYEPLTMLVRDERVSRVIFPVDPYHDAMSVVDWLQREARR